MLGRKMNAFQMGFTQNVEIFRRFRIRVKQLEGLRWWFYGDGGGGGLKVTAVVVGLWCRWRRRVEGVDGGGDGGGAGLKVGMCRMCGGCVDEDERARDQVSAFLTSFGTTHVIIKPLGPSLQFLQTTETNQAFNSLFNKGSGRSRKKN
ncbi:hypothetical protein Hdeb2414_s0235g00843261 [Helianthus debilis subsp. tardiflorus]